MITNPITLDEVTGIYTESNLGYTESEIQRYVFENRGYPTGADWDGKTILQLGMRAQYSVGVLRWVEALLVSDHLHATSRPGTQEVEYRLKSLPDPNEQLRDLVGVPL